MSRYHLRMGRGNTTTIVIMLVCMIGCDNNSAPRGQGGSGSGSTGSSGPGTGTDDAGTLEVDAGPIECVTKEFELSGDQIARYRPVSILAREGGFAVAWDQWDDRDEMLRADVPERGNPEEAAYIEISDVEGANNQAPVMAPGMLVFKSDLFGLASHELVAQPLNADSAPAGAPVRITNDDLEPSVPVLVPVESGFVLVYTQPNGDGTVVIGRSLDRAGKPGMAHQIASSGGIIAGVSATALDSKVAVGWVEPTAAGGEAWLQLTDANGFPTGKPALVSTEGNATGRIWLASDDAAALAVFEVIVSGWRREIRTRLLGLDGKPQRPEQILVFGPTRMAGISAAAFGGGFAVAYRALEDEKTETRVSFVHGSTGRHVNTVMTGETTATTEATTLAVTPEGTLLVAWSDIPPNDGAIADDVGAVIKATRITCPEAWLRCSKR